MQKDYKRIENRFQVFMDSLFHSFNQQVSMHNFAELSGCVFSWIEEQCKPGDLQVGSKNQTHPMYAKKQMSQMCLIISVCKDLVYSILFHDKQISQLCLIITLRQDLVYSIIFHDK